MLAPLLIGLSAAFPALVLALCARFPALDRVGVVVLCYVAGALLGNVGVLPPEAQAVQEPITEVTVALALPLLLFSMDVRTWLRTAGSALLSMGLAVVAVVAVATAGYLVLLPGVEGRWQIAGMAVGVYTGGTPNIAAIRTALSVDSSLFVAFHTVDALIGGLYVLFCVTLAGPLWRRFLRPFPKRDEGAEVHVEAEGGAEAYRGLLEPRILLGLLLALLLSAAVVGASMGIGAVVPEAYSMAALILAITTLGLAASFIGPVRRIERTFALGMYLVYVFCFTVGSMARVEAMAHIDPAVLGYIAACTFGSMALHGLLARLFRIDADTFIITSVAAICSPPFVPVVAAALRNRTVVLSGLTTGIIGYAIGNYLGISLALVLRGLGG